jgi:metallo-beta-lactamase family protein
MHLQCIGAAGRVTGSCHVIQAGDFRILLDCGLIQGSRKESELNRDPFPFDVSRIDAVVLSHAHIDHSGRLPLLVKRGFTGPIFAQDATGALCEIMLRDSANIQEHDAARLNRRIKEAGGEPVEPLYTSADAALALEQFRTVRYHRKFEVTPTIRARFQDAGHILGSCIVELWLTEGGDTRKVVFSGDLGHRDAPILRDPEVIKTADLVLMESTYGDRDHRSWDETRAEVEEIASITARARGNILIPAFAVGRSQLLLYWLARNSERVGLKNWQVFLDSPLAIRATEVYTNFINLLDKEARDFWHTTDFNSALPNFRPTLTADESREINQIRSGAIIIAGSGMCTGGRIRHHLMNNIGRKECHVIVIGYQAQGTPGRALVEGADEMRLFGKSVKVRARVHTIGGLSAHAGQRALIDWYDQYDGRPPLVLVHGEARAQEALAERISEELAAPVHVAQPGELFDLAKPIPF